MSMDSFSLQIAWNGLRSICDEAFLSLMRSSFSTNIKERHDHSTAILDASGRLIAQAEMSLPIHLASMTGMIETLLQKHQGRIAPGDIFCANDPHEAGGTHLPDINLAAPVFDGDTLVGFVAGNSGRLKSVGIVCLQTTVGCSDSASPIANISGYHHILEHYMVLDRAQRTMTVNATGMAQPTVASGDI